MRAGLLRPLGAGSVDVAESVARLEAAGYAGWYVLEQDAMLDGEPAGDGPLGNVGASIEFLEVGDCGRAVTGRTAPETPGGRRTPRACASAYWARPDRRTGPDQARGGGGDRLVAVAARVVPSGRWH